MHPHHHLPAHSSSTHQQYDVSLSSSLRRLSESTSCLLLIIIIASIVLLQSMNVVYGAFPANNMEVIGGGGTFAEEVQYVSVSFFF